MESKHLEFIDLDNKGRKTKVLEVRSKHDNSFLGTISWYSRWRQYVFQPSCGEVIVWSHDCLSDLAGFLKELMDERKKTRRG